MAEDVTPSAQPKQREEAPSIPPAYRAFGLTADAYDEALLHPDKCEKWDKLMLHVRSVMEEVMTKPSTRLDVNVKVALHRTVHKLAYAVDFDVNAGFCAGMATWLLRCQTSLFDCVQEVVTARELPGDLNGFSSQWSSYVRACRVLSSCTSPLFKLSADLQLGEDLDEKLKRIFTSCVFKPVKDRLLTQLEDLLHRARMDDGDTLAAINTFMQALTWMKTTAAVEVAAFKRQAIAMSCQKYFEDWVYSSPRHIISEIHKLYEKEREVCLRLAMPSSIEEGEKVINEKVTKRHFDGIIKQVVDEMGELLTADCASASHPSLFVGLSLAGRVGLHLQFIAAARDEYVRLGKQLVGDERDSGDVEKKKVAKRKRADDQRHAAAGMRSFLSYLFAIIEASDERYDEQHNKKISQPHVSGNDVQHLITSFKEGYRVVMRSMAHPLQNVSTILLHPSLRAGWPRPLLSCLVEQVDEKDKLEDTLLFMLGKSILAGNAEDGDELVYTVRSINHFAPSFLYKVTSMLQDSTLSTSSETREGLKPNSVFILSGSIWPAPFLAASIPDPAIMVEVVKGMKEGWERLKLSYAYQHPNRRLSFLPLLSDVDMDVSPPSSAPFSLKVPVFVAIVLITLQKCGQSMTTDAVFDLLPTLSNIEKEAIVSKLTSGLDRGASSSASSLCVVPPPSSSVGNESVTLQLNQHLKVKKKKYTISCMSLHPFTLRRGLARSLDERVDKGVRESRRLLIEAHIVRVMKYGKVNVPLQSVIAEVQEAYAGRFPLSSGEVKACVEGLIARDYLKRAKGDPSRLDYIA
uniref:Cullin family profile domain-containing protein n=1 Tax=Palpitomonas bilix TaxID=652834 RepID=A0A7S3LTC3_9EUKA|mmetsp:Transcript_4555/g.9424  ORF Transcript_4555/g.9424 Transcript_4555/m.9424 type:complete len:803 (+) Transcript_4555:218-2626(+)